MKKYEGKKVRIYGWALNIREQATNTFIDLRDGTGFLQAILSKKMVEMTT